MFSESTCAYVKYERPKGQKKRKKNVEKRRQKAKGDFTRNLNRPPSRTIKNAFGLLNDLTPTGVAAKIVVVVGSHAYETTRLVTIPRAGR